MFTVEEEQPDIIRAVTSFRPPVNESTHIIQKEGIGKVITTTDGVLLGKMSFQMSEVIFDVSWFSLVEGQYSPETGINISIDGQKYYSAQSTFRFTDQTASRDASLSGLILSSRRN